MAKIERKLLAHFLNTAPATTAVYERLGKNLEEYNVELSPEVETAKNILGETSVILSSYEATASVEPYFADKGTGLFTYLQDIIDNRKVLDDVVTDALEVHLWEPTSEAEGNTSFVAYKEVVHIAITSYGGDYNGYQIPFEVHYTGERTKGTFDTATKTFTPAA